MLGARAASRQKRNSFTSTWDTTQPGVLNNSGLAISLTPDGDYNCIVYWGDGTSDLVTSWSQRTHQYNDSGIYEVRIGGDITGFRPNNGEDDDKLLDISSWNSIDFGFGTNVFNGCSNLQISAKDAPKLSTYSSVCRSMFTNCTSLVTADFSNWDVSNLTDFSNMFTNCTSFVSGNFASWNTTGATTFSSMFSQCTSLIDEGVWNFDVSNTPTLSSMFTNCDQLGGEFGFDLSPYFPLNFNSNSVNVIPNTPYWANYSASGITFSSGINGLFYNAEFSNSFDQAEELKNNPTWTGVKNTYYLFGASPIPTWITGLETSNIEKFDLMFYFCNNFSGFINDWDFSSAASISRMFDSTTNLPDITLGTKTSGITDMSLLFYNNNDVTFPNFDIDTRSNQNFASMFRSTRYNGLDHTGWDTSSATDMKYMFQDTLSFNQDVEMWDVSNVTNMRFMFQLSDNFNQSLSGWNTSSLQDISYMLEAPFDDGIFNQDLSTWVVTGINQATSFLQGQTLSTTNYDRTLSGWAQQSGDLQAGVSIHFGNSVRSAATGQQYYDILTGVGWTIADGGSV